MPNESAIPAPDLAVRTIALDAPWSWLAAGWRDMWRIPGISLVYGAIFTGIAYVLTACLLVFDLVYLLLPLAAGFMLLGPMLAVGLYEASRRLEREDTVALGDVLFVSTRSPTQLAFIGVFLVLILLAWIRLATLLFALFFGTLHFPPLDQLLADLLFTAPGLGMLATGTVIGAALAFTVFAVSAVSVPLLMERDIDAVTAALISLRAVRANLRPMLLWAWLIALIIAFSMVPLFFGLIVAFPLIGHATWHAYRDLVG